MAKPFDMYNITAENIHSRAMTAILTACTIKNFHARDVFVHTDGGYVWTCGGHNLHMKGDQCFIYLPAREEEAQRRKVYPGNAGDGLIGENILIENVYHTARRADKPAALCSFNASRVKNAVVRNVCCEDDLPLYTLSNPAGALDVRFENVRIAGEALRDERLSI